MKAKGLKLGEFVYCDKCNSVSVGLDTCEFCGKTYCDNCGVQGKSCCYECEEWEE